MPQGKLKVKTNLPSAVKKKAKSHGPSIARKNKPALPKNNKLTRVQKINKTISKNVNTALEEEIRQIANDSQKVFLSKKKNVTNDASQPLPTTKK